MRGGNAPFVLLAGAALASGSAAAVTARAKLPLGHCRVIAGEKLPANFSKSICTEVQRAIGAVAPAKRYDVEVRVLSPSRLAAKLVVDGKALPKQNFAVMDSKLELDSIRQFARSLGELARTAER